MLNNNKKTIVIVIPTLQGNGAERVMLYLATDLQQKGHDVHIVIFKNIIELEYDGNINIHFFKKHYRWIPRSIRGAIVAPMLDKFIMHRCGGRPDLVLSNLIPIERILAYSRLNVYMVIQNTMSKRIVAHGDKLSDIVKPYTKKPTICCSKGVMDDFINTFSKYKIKESRYIYNPVNAQFVKKMGSSESSPLEGDYIVHVAKFKIAKRHDILIKAYHKSGVDEKLVLLGEGPYKEQSQALVKKLKLEDKVMFVGFKTNPYTYVKNAKLSVLSSDFEGLPTVILESLILGTPVISTDCESGPREMLPQKNLTPVNDIDALANKIKDAVNHIDDYRSDLKNEFLLENITKKYLELAN